MGFIGFNGKRYEVTRAEYDQLKGKSVDQKLNLLRSWGKEQEEPIIPSRAEILAQEQAQTEKQRKLEWIQQQEAKGSILSPSLKAEIEPVKKQAWIQRQEAKGAILSTTLKPTISTFEAGNEVPVSAGVARKLGLITPEQEQEAQARGEFFIVKADTRTEKVPVGIRKEPTIEDKAKNVIDNATNLEKVGMYAHTLLSPSGFGLLGATLIRKELTGTTPRQVVEERMAKIAREKSWENQANYAIESAINNPVTQVELAVLSGMGITKLASTAIGSRVLGSTAGKLLLGGLGIASVGYSGKNIAETYISGNKAEAYGKVLTLGFSVAGGIIGSKIEAGYLAGQQEIRLQPKTVIDRGVREEIKGDTVRFGKVDIINEDNSVIKAEYIGVKKGNIEKYYYKIPKQTIDTVDYGKVTIPEQTILDKSGDLAKIRYYQRTETEGGLTTKETGVKTLKGDISFTTEPETTGMESVKAIDKSLKSVDELTSMITSDKGISQTVRQGTSEMDYYIEKAFSTPKASVGKGEFFSLETGKPFNYYYFEKTITPKISGLTDFTQPVIRGTTGVSGTASTDTIISNTLTRLDSLRQLQEAQLTASINQGNVGRIAPIMPQLKTITENLSMDRPNRIVDSVLVSITENVRIKKKEKYIPPAVLNVNSINTAVDIAMKQATKGLQGAQGLIQAQTPAQKFIQEVDLITTPVTRQETRTVTQTRPPRITTLGVPQIERPPRIAFPRPFFNANLLGGGKDLDAYIRSIQHQIMSAMRLVV